MTCEPDGDGREIVIPGDRMEEDLVRFFLASLAANEEEKRTIMLCRHEENGLYEPSPDRNIDQGFKLQYRIEDHLGPFIIVRRYPQ